MRTLAKQRFAFTAENEKATYDLGLGAIERGNMSEKLFEVPAQKWADITDKSGEFGVSVISECKYGWDKWKDNTLRMTVLHTPKKNYRIDSMQSMMDLGLNRYSYAIYSHKNKVGADTQLKAREFIQPMAAFVFEKHQGRLGSSYSFGNVNTNDVIIRAIKKAHNSNEIVVRLNEGTNKTVENFALILGEGIESARELWASEEYKDAAVVKNGCLVTSFKPYEIKTFALTLKESEIKTEKSVCHPISLDYNCKIISQKGESSEELHNIPRNIIPAKITVGGVDYIVSQSNDKNALVCNEQEIAVNGADKIKLLCTGTMNSDLFDNFMVDGKAVFKQINSYEEAFARWDLYDFGETAYIKKGHLGFEATHSLDKNGNILWAKGLYLWVVTLDTRGADKVTLPYHPDIVIVAATAVKDDANASLVTPLYDEIENNRPFTFKKNFKEKLWYLQSKLIWNINDKDDYFRHNNNGKNGKRTEQSKKNL